MSDRNREDESVACRGSINMAVAVLNPSTDGSRFEVSSRVSYSAPKFIVKSAHRAEIARWVQAVKLNIEYYSKGGPPSKRTLSMNSLLSEKPTAAAVRALPPTDNFLSTDLKRSTTGLSGISIASPLATIKDGSPTMTNVTAEEDGDTLSILEAADKESLLGSDPQHGQGHGIPHEATYDIGVLSIKAQLDTTIQLVESFTIAQSSSARSEDARFIAEALRSSLTTLSNLISQQSIMTQDRERYLVNRINREVEARKVWEENMLTVARQQEETDRQLALAAQDNEKKRRALRQAKGVLAELAGNASTPGSPSKNTFSSLPSTSADTSASITGVIDLPLSAGSRGPVSPGWPSTSGGGVLSPITSRASISNIQEVQNALDAADSDTEDGDDEFFDAIETNNIPNLRVLHDSIAHPEGARPGTPQGDTKKFDFHAPRQKTIKEFLARKSLEPYLYVRNKLPIDDDKRPSVSRVLHLCP